MHRYRAIAAHLHVLLRRKTAHCNYATRCDHYRTLCGLVALCERHSLTARLALSKP